MSSHSTTPFPDPSGRDQPDSPETSPRILVVDDDADLRRLNARLLTKAGFRVTTASDGAAALAALYADSYDLLLTDHNMPRLTGVELLNELHHAGKTLPTIMVTGNPPEDLNRYPWLQIAETLLKPYSATDLPTTVRRVLSSANIGALNTAAPGVDTPKGAEGITRS